MKYDLIVVGGGPGGLMAAKTAAEDGLKVIVIERKKNITEINRICSQNLYMRKPHPTRKKMSADGYIEPVALEFSYHTTKFIFPGPGFSLEYNGPIKPYYNWIEVSPSKHCIYARKDNPWAWFYDKEVFCSELLASAQNAGAEVWPETIGMGAENIPGGVRVSARGKSGDQTLEARAAIAADGGDSQIVASLGFNKKRLVLMPEVKMVGYDIEGAECDLPPNSFVCFCIPSINQLMVVFWGHMAGNISRLSTGTEETCEKLMVHPTYASWFRHARVVKKTGWTGTIRTPVLEPVEGNVVVVGDAGAPIETWTQGAVASAYMGVKAIEKELSGRKGYAEYIDWWQKAFYFNTYDYFSMVMRQFALANAWADDDEVDFIYSLLEDLEDNVGRLPQILIDENLELIKERRPQFYERLQKGYEEAEKMLPQLIGRIP